MVPSMTVICLVDNPITLAEVTRLSVQFDISTSPQDVESRNLNPRGLLFLTAHVFPGFNPKAMGVFPIHIFVPLYLHPSTLLCLDSCADVRIRFPFVVSHLASQAPSLLTICVRLPSSVPFTYVQLTSLCHQPIVRLQQHVFNFFETPHLY